MSTRTMTVTRALLRRWVMPAALVSMTVGAGAGVFAPQAGLASTRGVLTLPATGPILSGYHKNKCIDDLGDSAKNKTPIVMWDCNSTPEQNFTLETDGTIQINGKCVDIVRDEKRNKSPVELYTCKPSGSNANQLWEAVGNTLVNPVSHKCLDDPRFNTTNGTQLVIYTCNGGRNQDWMLPSGSSS